MRRRSSATRRLASSSRVRSARSARSRIAVMKARRLRTASPTATAIAVQASSPKFSCAYQGSGPVSIATPTSTALVSSPMRQAVGRSVCTAKV
ncbi:hypothetical protein GA0115252_11896 [Streptomyces sp. DfronAA-171]|nr:hypothetical protein GA0115252_11896 [Streptomyces sp. DfronAA-171]